MKDKRRSKGKSIRPTFFVFCEGQTEEAYVKYLRSKYRLPIDIDPNVAGLGITNDHIARYKKDKITDSKDKNYLMYDLDRADILERLETIKDATILSSNPCIEIWFLLHYINQKAEINSADCCKALANHIPKYKKGAICKELQAKLETAGLDARKRAAKLNNRGNPSTEIPLLIKDLEAEAAHR